MSGRKWKKIMTHWNQFKLILHSGPSRSWSNPECHGGMRSKSRSPQMNFSEAIACTHPSLLLNLYWTVSEVVQFSNQFPTSYVGRKECRRQNLSWGAGSPKAGERKTPESECHVFSWRKQVTNALATWIHHHRPLWRRRYAENLYSIMLAYLFFYSPPSYFSLYQGVVHRGSNFRVLTKSELNFWKIGRQRASPSYVWAGGWSMAWAWWSLGVARLGGQDANLFYK